jgi:hypothetical protein
VVVVVGGDGAAEHDAGVVGEAPQHVVEDRAAGVVEEDVDPLRAQLAEPRRDVVGAVVDGPVDAEVVDQPGALLVGAGDADHAAAQDLGDLDRDGAGGAGRRRHDDRLPRRDLADLGQADVGGEPVGPEDAERGLRVGPLRQRGGEHRVVADHRVLLPAGEGGHQRALRHLRAAGADDATDAAAAHDLADLDRRDVALGLREPGAHRGVDADPLGADEHLAVGGLGHRDLVVGEVLLPHQPVGALGEQDASVPQVGHRRRVSAGRLHACTHS